MAQPVQRKNKVRVGTEELRMTYVFRGADDLGKRGCMNKTVWDGEWAGLGMWQRRPPVLMLNEPVVLIILPKAAWQERWKEVPAVSRKEPLGQTHAVSQ